MGGEEKTKGSLARSLAIALAAHALLFLFLALLIPHSPVVFYAPSITFVAAPSTGGSGGRTAAAAVPAAPKPAPLPKAPAPQAPAARAPAAPASLPAVPPAASPPASPAETSQQVASGGPSADNSTGAKDAGDGTGGSGGSAGSGSGTASAFAPETDSDPQTPIADINPVPMWDIAASYPPSARRLGQQGLVKVETDINEKGFVTASRVAVSSGFPSLDKAAVVAVQLARFLPAMKNGRAVASRILIPIRFKLTKE